ncbi:hypothetical protein [Ideonella sp.]|uniref:hypothetical protein n=1 Tax=Ideonella sp. TaxID=1929293 RepID=UPI003BB800C2
MISSHTEQLALRATVELEATVSAVEQQLTALGNALKLQDAAAAEAAASELHRSLARAVDHFARASRSSAGVPPELRRRLARTSGQVAAQRDAVARATNALDRAIDVLLPASAAPQAVYGASGSGRSSSSGLAQA